MQDQKVYARIWLCSGRTIPSMKIIKATLTLQLNSDNPSLDNTLDLKAKALKALLELETRRKYICKKLQAL